MKKLSLLLLLSCTPQSTVIVQDDICAGVQSIHEDKVAGVCWVKATTISSVSLMSIPCSVVEHCKKKLSGEK